MAWRVGDPVEIIPRPTSTSASGLSRSRSISGARCSASTGRRQARTIVPVPGSGDVLMVMRLDWLARSPSRVATGQILPTMRRCLCIECWRQELLEAASRSIWLTNDRSAVGAHASRSIDTIGAGDRSARPMIVGGRRPCSIWLPGDCGTIRPDAPGTVNPIGTRDCIGWLNESQGANRRYDEQQGVFHCE
jgi:hypothetical protein